jgi:diguanylate cyclase (GGDEF)-like protein
VTANLLFGGGLALGLGFATFDILEILVVAAALRQVSSVAPLFCSVSQFTRFVIVCAFVPLVSATAGSSLLVYVQGMRFLEVWPGWYLSLTFGLLIVTPSLLIWTDRARMAARSRRTNLEIALLTVLVAAAGWLDFGYNATPGVFLCFPFLLLTAFRGGLPGATIAVIVLTAVASGYTLSGQGPIAELPDTDMNTQLLMLQLYLAVVLISTLPVGGIAEHRQLLNATLDQTLSKLSRMAHHDVLTGLPNRVMFQERLAWTQALAHREGGNTALLMVDLDRFKPVNDVHGHAAGDRLLQLVAKRLCTAARGTDTVARLGGDEFAVIAHVDSPEAAQHLAQRVITTLGEPFDLGSTKVEVGCSVGIAVSPSGSTNAELFVQYADAALYRAKAEGRNCFRFFEPGMDIKIRERAEIEAELRHAIAQGELVPHYQPIVMLGGHLVGFEVLARWTHPTRGEISPTVFVPLAESAGLIGQLTEQLLRRACRAALTWPEHLFIAVNVSPVQLRDRRLPDLVRSILVETGLPVQRLEIELTESALINDFDLAREILFDLKAMGVKLALDDFGTGYSSLRHLQGLPIDKIKIDMGFVSTMMTLGPSRKIVAGVIGLGHSLGLPIVAEGIEDLAAADTLRVMGCDLGQGWLFGRAIPANEVDTMLQQMTVGTFEFTQDHLTF